MISLILSKIAMSSWVVFFCNYKSCFGHAELDEIVSILLNRSENLFRTRKKKAVRESHVIRSIGSTNHGGCLCSVIFVSGDLEGALGDAAAVLTLRPDHAKGWQKYAKAFCAMESFQGSAMAAQIAAAHGVVEPEEERPPKKLSDHRS